VTGTTTGEDRVSVQAATHATYRALGSLFLPPDEERLAMLVTAVPQLHRVTEPLEGMAGHRSWIALLDRLAALDDDGVDAMAPEYTNLFLSGSRDYTVQPFESSHVPVSEFDVATVSAAVEARYRRAGFQLVSKGGLPDHIAVELEFCASLAHLEGDTSDDTKAERYRSQRRSFLADHLTRWLPSFIDQLQGVTPGSIYADAAVAARDAAADDELVIDAMSATWSA
jgi:TorA maturation chaperone TorD